MNKNFIFFISATLILVLTIAAFNTGPVINKKIGNNWRVINCQLLSDVYNLEKDKYESDEEIEIKKQKENLNSCKRKKAMSDLEKSAFTIDVIIGFICSLLGLLHILDEGKSFVKKTGLIGFILGAIGFVITLVYFVFSILVYIKDTKDSEVIYKADEDSAYAKYDSSLGVYVWSYFEKDNYDAIYAKYSELGKKQYNYNKKLYQAFHNDDNSMVRLCYVNPQNLNYNNNESTSNSAKYYIDKDRNRQLCNKLYMEPFETITNKNIYEVFFTTIILTAIIILGEIALTIFGFLLFKKKEDS